MKIEKFFYFLRGLSVPVSSSDKEKWGLFLYECLIEGIRSWNEGTFEALQHLAGVSHAHSYKIEAVISGSILRVGTDSPGRVIGRGGENLKKMLAILASIKKEFPEARIPSRIEVFSSFPAAPLVSLRRRTVCFSKLKSTTVSDPEGKLFPLLLQKIGCSFEYPRSKRNIGELVISLTRQYSEYTDSREFFFLEVLSTRMFVNMKIMFTDKGEGVLHFHGHSGVDLDVENENIQILLKQIMQNL